MTTTGRRTWQTWQLAVTAALFLVIGIVAGSSTTEDEVPVQAGQADQPATTEGTATPTSPPTTATPTTVAPTTTTTAGPRTSFGEGTWRVGTDIAPGTYTAPGSDGCYWARLKNLTGSDDILANHLGPGPATVTILASDAGFQTRRCGTWTRA